MKWKDPFDGDIFGRSEKAIAHGALTNSKRPQSFVKGLYPTHLKKSQGCYSWDTNDNKYIDFIAGLGANLLGAAEEEVTEAIIKEARNGTIHSLGSKIEVEAAEAIKANFPFIQKLRFLKTGSDACSAAIRIARTYTDRTIVITDGYHGWHDEFVSLTAPANGCFFKKSYIRQLADIELQIKGSNQIAAVIVEPIITDHSTERIDYLKYLKRLCETHGVLLIFDEIITGLRFPENSVSRQYGITADLVCFGKAIGGGMPLSVVGGRDEVMESDYFVSSTFAGETLSLAACMKTLELLQNKYSIEYLWEKGTQFLTRFNSLWKEGIRLEGYPTRSRFIGEEKTRALFMQECAKAGILVGPSFFFTFPHIPLMDEALSSFQDILLRIRTGNVELLGEMPIQSYAQKMRE